MILKLMDFHQMHYTAPETTFLDGFDNVRVIDYDLNQAGKLEGFGCIVSFYTDDGSKICKQIMLFKGEELVKVLYVDVRFSIYLMSNEGKTIERIN